MTAINDTHDIRIVNGRGEVIVACATCNDEIGSSFVSIRLDEVQRLVEAHHNGSEATP